MFAFMESNNIGVTHALFWMVRPSASPETTNFPPLSNILLSHIQTVDPASTRRPGLWFWRIWAAGSRPTTSMQRVLQHSTTRHSAKAWRASSVLSR